MSEKAVIACLEYERWAGEVTRLTIAISECRCPKEWDGIDAYDEQGGSSCFQIAREESMPRHRPDDGPQRRTLDQIGEVVADCGSCARLVVLIRERKRARQRWGVAKRKVRHAGKLAARPSHGESKP